MDLLERSALLADLDAALAASGSAGRVVLVSGEAGIGKSALVRRFVRRRENEARFLVGLCDPLLTPRALGPLRDIAGQTGGPLAGRLAAEAAREEVFAAFLDELLRHRRPQVVVVEDAHWADEATLDLLVFLGRRLERVRAMLVVTYRDDEVDMDHPLRAVLGGLPPERTRRLRPAPLSEAAVAELARRAGRVTGRLHAETGGNPLLVTEVLAAGGPEVPRTVRDLVLARLAGLGPDEQEVTRFVAVIPTRAELWLLEAALGPDPAVVEACAAAGLLVLTEDAVGFRHELTRRAVEESLSPLRRRDLNRRAFEVLAAAAGHGVDLARLVHHARQAGDAPAVLRYAPPAAREATAVGAHREAVGHYRAALGHADALPGPARAELLEGYAFNAYLVGLPDEALAARQDALSLREAGGQFGKVGENLRWLSRLYWWAGRREEAEQAAARAIAVLERGEPGGELAMAYSNQAQLDMLAHRSTAAVEWGSRAIALAERIGDRETTAHALTNIGVARLEAGDQAGRVELEQAVELAVREDLPDHAARALVGLGYAALEFHDFTQARRYIDRGLEFALARDLAGYAKYLTGMRAWSGLYQGDWEAAGRDAAEVLAQRQRPGISAVPALVALGRLQARRGEAGAVDTLDEAARRSFSSGELQRVAPVAAARAEHAWLRGERDRVVTEAARAFELTVRLGHPWYAGELAWWLWRAGERPETPSWLAEPYRLLLAGDWREAAGAWAERGCPYEQADALACADDDEALLRALEVFDRLGAVPAARQVRRRLRGRGNLRVPRGPRPATAGNPANLTARQMEVLALLARRLTNAEIAARLSLSVRTVDHHVSAVLTKLAVRSRDQAAAAARRLGLVPVQDGQPGGPS